MIGLVRHGHCGSKTGICMKVTYRFIMRKTHHGRSCCPWLCSSTETSIIIIMIVKELVVFKLNDFSSSADIYKRRPPLFVFRAAVISYYWPVSRPCSSCNAGTNVNHHRHHRPRRLRRRLEWWRRRGGRKTCMKPI